MANTLPILGVNNTGLTFRLPRWDHRLKYDAGSVVIYDTDSDSTTTTYGLFILPSTDKGPFTEVGDNSPTDDSDWQQIS